MSVRVLYLAGVPASGKSSIFRRIRKKHFPTPTEFTHGAARGIVQGNLAMLGVFDGSTFEGTDRLSMTVIGDAIDYVRTLEADSAKHVLLVEGDRLFNERFLRETRAALVLIDAAPEVLDARHHERGDTQTQTFLKGRRSKVENFAKKHRLRRVMNNDLADQDRIVAGISTLIEQWQQ